MGDSSGDLSLGYMMGQSENRGGGNGWGNGWGNDIIGLAALGLIFGRNGLAGGGLFDNGGGGGNSGVSAGFAWQGIDNGIRGIQQGLCDGFYAVNTGMLNGFHGVDNAICNLGYQTQSGFNTLGHQLSDCCCENRAAIADLKYTFATESCATRNLMQNTTRDIIESHNCNFRALNDVIRDGFAQAEARENQRYIADLERRLNACDRDGALRDLGTYLVNTLRPMPTPSYPSCNPWAASFGYGGCGNGCNNGCGCC